VSTREKENLPTCGTREQRRQNEGHQHQDRQQLGVSKCVADLIDTNLGAKGDRADGDGGPNQDIDGKDADGEANGDLDDFAYDCTTS